MPIRRLLLVSLATLALAPGLAACGDDDEGGDASGTNASPAQTAPAEQEVEISANTEAKPQIGKPSGEPPTELVKEDIVVGKGPGAKDGDQVTVDYVGVTFSYGDQFDASWDRGQPFTFKLGAGKVIPGWEQGVKGMKVGGRRKLTIPSEMAYGAQGSPPSIPPNEPLVFVIDLRKIG
jgi:peptidylprolyl isomerase